MHPVEADRLVEHVATSAPGDPPAVELTEVRRRFPGQEQAAVDGVSLQVMPGEIVSLVGESGCGKTTTLRLIAGFETPDAGQIALDGQGVAEPGRAAAPNLRPTGVVFQEHALFPHLTVADNIAFGIRKLPREEREARVRELLDLAAIAGLAGRYPHQLSGGQAQRVALARALAPRPRVVLMDEPFNNLDVGLRFRLLRDVERVLRAEGASAVLVTHDWKEAFAVSDRIAIMSGGRILQTGPPREVYERPESRYVAEFFGPINDLPDSVGSTRLAYIRPRDVLVCQGTHCPYPNCRAYTGVVEERRFLGEYQEVVCRVTGNRAPAPDQDAPAEAVGTVPPESDGGYRIVAYVPAQLSVSEGDSVVAACPEGRLMHFDEAS